MKALNTLLLMLSLYTQNSAVAQSSRGSPTGASGLSRPSLTIEAARAVSQADFERIKRELDTESDKGSNFDVCRIKILELQQKYAQWFKDRYQEFAQVETQIDQALAALQKKMVALKSTNIQAIPVPGQTQSSVNIGYNTIISYLRNYNSRIKSCSKDKLELLKQIQENPLRNPLKVSHSQIVTAMQQMTVNLNASLKQTSANYSLGFAEAECGYDLILSVDAEVKPGTRKKLDISLLDRNSTTTMTRSQKWAMYYGDGQRIDGYSASGNIRYLEMYQKSIVPECALHDWSQVPAGELLPARSPYVPFSQVNAEITAAAKRILAYSTKVGGRQAEVQKRLKFELLPDQGNCQNHITQYGVETFAPYIDGKQIATGCVFGVHLVEFSGDIAIFGIGADHNIWVRQASAPIKTEWTRVTGDNATISIVASGVYNNRPYMIGMTNTGETYAMDSTGSRIANAGLLIPPSSMGNTPARRISLDAPGQCASSLPDHGSLKLDGKAIPASGCVRQFLALPLYNDFFIFGIGGDGLFYRTLYSKWERLGSFTGVAKLTNVSISNNGHPQVTYTTTQGQTNTYELH